MTDHWEYVFLLILLGPVSIGLVTYVVVSEWLCWYGTRHWMRTHFQRWYPATPIYGSADPYRTKGPNAKQNVRI